MTAQREPEPSPADPWADFARMVDNPSVDLAPQEVVEVLQCLDELDMAGDLFWRAHPNGVVHFYINCSDSFVWASADSEPLSPATLPALRQAYADLKALGGYAYVYAGLLYCSRMRKFRPQHACYPKDAPEVWALLDAAGPERTPGFGNPRLHPAH